MSLNGTQFRASCDSIDNGLVLIAATHPTGPFEFCAHMQILRRNALICACGKCRNRTVPRRRYDHPGQDQQKIAPRAPSTRRAILDLEAQGAVLIFGSGRVADQHEGLLVEPPWRWPDRAVARERAGGARRVKSQFQCLLLSPVTCGFCREATPILAQ